MGVRLRGRMGMVFNPANSEVINYIELLCFFIARRDMR
ncbi:hypothetical protein ECDEC1E_3064 [Escherichia coli DEC1E]|nr:hypothetical protein ECDEC1E_3064 [Escherichia coli DEC1E]